MKINIDTDKKEIEILADINLLTFIKEIGALLQQETLQYKLIGSEKDSYTPYIYNPQIYPVQHQIKEFLTLNG